MIRRHGNIFRLPAVRFFLMLAGGILLSESVHVDSRVALTLVLSLIPFILVFAYFATRHFAFKLLSLALTSLLVFGLGCYLGNRWSESIDSSLLEFADGKSRVRVIGIVEDHPQRKQDRVSFFLEVIKVNTDTAERRLNAKTLVYYSRSSFDPDDKLKPVQVGDTVALDGTLRTPQAARNPGGFNFRSYLIRHSVTTVMSVNAGNRLHIIGTAEPSFFQTVLDEIRSTTQRGIRRLYRDDNADIMHGLILGERGSIRDEITDAFRDAGVVHILAVSGLHVGIILAMVWIPFGRLSLRFRIPLALLVLWCYAFLTGMAPPVVRATFMATSVLLSFASQRLTNPVNNLAAAGALILLVSPQALFLPGFQLSFSAVIAILLGYDRLQWFLLQRFERLRESFILKNLASLLALTIMAQVGTLPFVLVYFERISFVGLAANLIVVPLVFVVVAAGVLGVLLHSLWLGAAILFAETSSFALDIILTVSEWLSSLPFAVMLVPDVPWLFLTAYVLCVVVLLHQRARFLTRLIVVMLIVTASFSFGWAATEAPASAILRLTFLDVGQGDATLVEFPNGKNMLIDCGPMVRNYDSGARTVLPYLQRRGIKTLDVLVLTHPDNDHIGGARAILRAFDVRRIYYACKWKAEGLQFHVDSLMKIEGAKLYDVRAGERIALDPTTRAYVLSPPRDSDATFASNNTSIVLKIIYGKTSFLLTGDAEKEAEAEMVRRYGDLLASDVYKVGHHGSLTSTTLSFILKVKPTHAVISCGRLNRFNHPRQEILTRLKFIGAQVYRTDLEGAIILESDGKDIQRKRWR